jgi:diaminopimelate decarboxylase
VTTPWLTLSPDEAAHLAQAHGTPFYVYDLGVLHARVALARAALPAELLYAVKANPHPALLASLAGRVDGLDVASEGELSRARAAGFTRLSFAGPGKSLASLEAALATPGAVLSLESVRELELVSQLARARGLRVSVRLRLNPRTQLNAYRVAMTGGPSPFGIDEEELAPAATALRAHEDALDFDGLHVHPGGQCTSAGGFGAAVATALDLTLRLWQEHGLAARKVNLGGGFGVLSPNQELDVAAAGRKLEAMLAKFHAATGLQVRAVVEPGRWLVGPAGLYVARVVSVKRSRGTRFVVLDGGLNHHLGATGHLSHADAPPAELINLSRPDAAPVTCTVTGPLCTPLDVLGRAVQLPEPRLGDLIAVLGAGAYGYSFSPLHFLGHPLPHEVLLPAPPT